MNPKNGPNSLIYTIDYYLLEYVSNPIALIKRGFGIANADPTFY